MKKLLTIALLFVMLTMVLVTVVNAATTDTIANELYAIGSKYGMKEAEKVKMVKYLHDYPLSDADCNRILALAQQADQIMKDNNTTSYKSVSSDVKAKLKSLAIEAADIAGVELDFKTDGVDIYKNGTLIESITASTVGQLAYTGSNVNIAVVVSSVVAIAMVATVVVRKKLAVNA